MKFSILTFLAFTLLGSSCSKNEITIEPEPIPVPEIEGYHLNLHAKAEGVSIFQGVEFSIQDSSVVDNVPNGAVVLKYRFLDSLIWTVDGASKSLQLIERVGNSENRKGLWTHYFYEPGDFTAYLKGYFNGKLVVNDSTIIHVSLNDKSDFLSIKWDEVKDDFQSGHVGYGVNGLEDYTFGIYYGVYGGVKSATLDLQFDNIYERSWEERLVRKKQVFEDYITKLYGSSKQLESTEQMNAYYDANFKKPLKGASVLKVWQTVSSNIALISESKEVASRGDYQIYAEPRK